ILLQLFELFARRYLTTFLFNCQVKLILSHLNTNNVIPLTVKGVLFFSAAGSESTALLDDNEQRETYPGPQKRDTITCSVSLEEAEEMSGQTVNLVVVNSGENHFSYKFDFPEL
ncbi:MAG: hypothetical protein JW885_02995, partial [Deltaproteobacteria bacterium]|nr:hypothetical protein [Candidatus Zymogenaceae bacterium]